MSDVVAVILASGLGDACQPPIPKSWCQLVPLVDRPVIQYSVEEAAASGITDAVIVTAEGDGKRCHPRLLLTACRSYSLELLLERRGNKEALGQHHRHEPCHAHLLDVRQQEQLGIAHAVKEARHAIGEAPLSSTSRTMSLWARRRR